MKLGLGTVQFGLDYGISNKSGAVPIAEARSILALAFQNGIRTLDTASAYGSSESALGEAVSNEQQFEIVTKTSQGATKKIRQDFETSLERLRASSVYGLLVHSVEDVLNVATGHEIMSLLTELKSSGLVKKIGVSVYNSEQIDRVLEHYSVDLVQLPINIFDQRLIQSGHLSKLKKAGIEVHARSVFLQGLLLMAPGEVPSHLSGVRSYLEQIRDDMRGCGISMLQAALGFVLAQSEVDRVLVGVCSRAQLAEILAATSHSFSGSGVDFSSYALKDEKIINPSRWSQSA